MSRPLAQLFREMDEARAREMKSMETNAVVTHTESSDSRESKAWSVTVNRVPAGVPLAGRLSLPAATDLPDDVRAALVEWLGLTGAAKYWRGLTAQHLAYAREHDGAAMPPSPTMCRCSAIPDITVITGQQTHGTHQPAVPATTWGSGTRITANGSQAPGTTSGSHR